MKNKLYIIIPIVVIILILLNAFFGHLVFDSPYEQVINKYSIYVHLQPEWNSYPGNIIYDITNVWSSSEHKTQRLSDENSDFLEFDNYNSNQLRFQNHKSYVELKHQFSDCESSWKPHLYRYLIDSIRSNIESFQGTQINNDPYITIYPNKPNNQHSLEKQQEIIRQGYVQFIPICSSKNLTSYEFAISINDKETTFDAYFIPSETEMINYLENKSFLFYPQEGCFAINHYSFSGKCENIETNSGLLIIIPDNLNLTLTKLKINLHEK